MHRFIAVIQQLAAFNVATIAEAYSEYRFCERLELHAVLRNNSENINSVFGIPKIFGIQNTVCAND